MTEEQKKSDFDRLPDKERETLIELAYCEGAEFALDLLDLLPTEQLKAVFADYTREYPEDE